MSRSFCRVHEQEICIYRRLVPSAEKPTNRSKGYIHIHQLFPGLDTMNRDGVDNVPLVANDQFVSVRTSRPIDQNIGLRAYQVLPVRLEQGRFESNHIYIWPYINVINNEKILKFDNYVFVCHIRYI